MFILGWVNVTIECILMLIFRIICGGNHYSFKRIRRCLSVLRVFMPLNGFVAGWFLYKSIIYNSTEFVILPAVSLVMSFVGVYEIKWLRALTRVNRNRRVYTPELIQSAVKAYHEKGFDKISFVGEIDHPKE